VENISNTTCWTEKRPPPPLLQVAQETAEAQSILLEAVESHVARHIYCTQLNYKPTKRSVSGMAHRPNSLLEMALCACQWNCHNLQKKSSMHLQVHSNPPHETTTPPKTPAQCDAPRNSIALHADVNLLYQRQHDPTTGPPAYRPILPGRHCGTATVLAQKSYQQGR